MDRILAGLKITADVGCIHEIRRFCFLGKKKKKKKKHFDKPRQMIKKKKKKDITLLTKILTGKAMAFKLVIYRCDSWTKKAEHQRIRAFKLWFWKYS